MLPTSILFAGHDLKFLTHVIRHFEQKKDHKITVLTYSSHALTDTDKILAELHRYDIIFCEWGLGNLKWFSQNKFPGQKLVVRIHSQEFATSYWTETKWDNVDRIIFVGPHMMAKFLKLYPDLQSKCQVIYNLVDTSQFDRKKEQQSRFHLGMLGILPMIKSPHMALEILAKLRKTDPHYKLFIKSKRPEELEWLWKRPEEKEYYTEFFEKINQMGLAEAVIFEPHGPDVAEWFRHIGFVLSTSDNEAFHMAVAEGMASGSIPLIRSWPGAKDLYPQRLIFDHPAEAASRLQEYTDPKKLSKEVKTLKQFCQDHFSLEVILPEYDNVLMREVDRYKLRKVMKKMVLKHQEIIEQENLLMKENDRLKSDILTLSENNSKLKNQIAQLNETSTRLKTDVASLTENNNLLKANLASLNESNVMLKTDLITLKEMQSQLRTELAGMKELNRKMQSDLVVNKQANEKLNLEKLNLIHELGIFKETTKSLRTDLRNLQAELKETQRRYTDMENSLSWKVGSALIKKPAGVIRKITKKQ